MGIKQNIIGKEEMGERKMGFHLFVDTACLIRPERYSLGNWFNTNNGFFHFG